MICWSLEEILDVSTGLDYLVIMLLYFFCYEYKIPYNNIPFDLSYQVACELYSIMKHLKSKNLGFLLTEVMSTVLVL